MSIIIDTPARLSRALSAISTLQLSVDELTVTRIVSGSQTITSGKILNEDGTDILDEDGGDIIEDSAPSTPAVEVDILTEDGVDLLNEDGTKILNEDSTSAVVVVGIATPLAYVSIPCKYVVASAKSTNYGTVWISGSDVEVGLGIPLIVGEDNVNLPISDVSKVYIIGYSGDGVTFVYGTSDGTITDDDGNPITDDDGNPITVG